MGYGPKQPKLGLNPDFGIYGVESDNKFTPNLANPLAVFGGDRTEKMGAIRVIVLVSESHLSLRAVPQPSYERHPAPKALFPPRRDYRAHR